MEYIESILGADQQAPAGILVDLFAPTDFDKAAQKIGDSFNEIMDARKVNFFSRLGKGAGLNTFISRVISYAKQTGLVLGTDTAEAFKTALQSNFGYSDEDISDYITAYLMALQKGEIPATIAAPGGYQSTTVMEDVTKPVAAAVSNGFNKVLIVGALALVAYGIGKAYVFKKL
jgi:hypothetical protein